MKHQHTIKPYQCTIRKSIDFKGVGLHSGKEVSMTLKPAEANSGILFVRTDLPGDNTIPAFMNRVVDTRLATTISENGVTVATTEHLLAALSGLGIDNIIIELGAAEVPIMDGSAAAFAEKIQDAGILRQNSHRRVVRITDTIIFHDDERTVRIEPYDGLKITAEIDFDHQTIKQQNFSITVDRQSFINDISAARTFGFVEDVEQLQRNGLALGASLENAIGLDRKGVVNKEGLRFANEFVRHKILDILGDMTLLGCPVLGHVIAYKSGHGHHVGLLQEIAASPEAWEFVELKKNGQFSVLDKVVSTTKAARQRLLPFMVPHSI
jgi:UDP-3-O-[3-hydroxymyristoyl] N-acetylglucosamine deacetylase